MDEEHEQLIHYRDVCVRHVINAVSLLLVERNRAEKGDSFHQARLNKCDERLSARLRQHSQAEVALLQYTGLYDEVFGRDRET